MHRKYPALDRHERFYGFLSLVTDAVWLGKLCLAAFLFWVSLKWIGEVMGGSTAALFFYGLAQDGLAKFLSIFQVHP